MKAGRHQLASSHIVDAIEHLEAAIAENGGELVKETRKLLIWVAILEERKDGEDENRVKDLLSIWKQCQEMGEHAVSMAMGSPEDRRR